jgi:hypothetical protein
MKRLIAVLCLSVLIVTIAATEDYKTLTIEEAREYVLLNPEAAAQDVVKLDALEHAKPVVIMPSLILSISGINAGLSWGGPIDVSIAGGALHYALTPDPSFFPGIVPRAPWWESAIWGIGGAIAGFLGGLITGIAVSK